VRSPGRGLIRNIGTFIVKTKLLQVYFMGHCTAEGKEKVVNIRRRELSQVYFPYNEILIEFSPYFSKQ
jgi:hypothetical protein